MADAQGDLIELKNLRSLRFGLLSSAEIREIAVVEIKSEETFANGRPVQGGLFDTRMGTIERSELCATCLQNPTNCPGHFGFLRLAAPLFHPQFLDVTKKVLELVCFNCSRILIEPHKIHEVKKIRKNKRLEYLKNLNKKVCFSCGFLQPAIKKAKTQMKLIFINKNEEDKENNLTPNLARDILKRISPDDVVILGFAANNRPEWMIMELLLISPPSMRPTVTSDSGQRGEDDITVYLSHIVKGNKNLRDKIVSEVKSAKDDNIITSLIDNLNIYVSDMIVGGVKKGAGGLTSGTSLKTRSGKSLSSIANRLSGKYGMTRKHLMGKRVNFSARSVISPDPNLSIDELGMPLPIAENLTFPDTVNERNKAQMYQYIMNNKRGIYPMAKQIKQGNLLRTIEHIKDIEDIVLEDGDLVIRQVIDGDICLFNRQPTLHRMSMMAFKVVVMPIGKTFRINLSVTTASN